jgi:hypothetical protein
MIEDMQHIQVLDALGKEIVSLAFDYNVRANGVTDKATLIALRVEQNEALCELLAKHRRALDFMAGKPVKPVAHTAEAVLIGVVGGLAP